MGELQTLQSWWDIAQVAGAGAAVVLGPILYFVWTAREKDLEYIRQSDKDTLKILSELTVVMKTDGKDGERRHVELEKAIKHSTDSIKAHIDAAQRSQRS